MKPARAWRGTIRLGRIHVACGEPVRPSPESDVPGIADAIIRSLETATVSTTFHLEAFLARYCLDGLDPLRLRQEIETRGGRVLDSPLPASPNLDPHIAGTFRYQFEHLFRTESGDPPFEPIFAEIRERDPSEAVNAPS